MRCVDLSAPAVTAGLAANSITTPSMDRSVPTLAAASLSRAPASVSSAKRTEAAVVVRSAPARLATRDADIRSRRPPTLLQLLDLPQPATRASLRRRSTPILRGACGAEASAEGWHGERAGGEGEEAADHHHEAVDGDSYPRILAVDSLSLIIPPQTLGRKLGIAVI